MSEPMWIGPEGQRAERPPRKGYGYAHGWRQESMSDSQIERWTQVVKDAIGYEPVRVSIAPGNGGLTHRTAEDRDGLIERLVPAILESLEEPKCEHASQEPVAWLCVHENGEEHIDFTGTRRRVETGISRALNFEQTCPRAKPLYSSGESFPEG